MLFCHSRGRHCLHRPSFVRLIIRCRLRESRWTTIFFFPFLLTARVSRSTNPHLNFFPFRFDQRHVIHTETRKFIWNNSSAAWASQWSNHRQLCEKQPHQPTKLNHTVEPQIWAGMHIIFTIGFWRTHRCCKEKKKSDLKNIKKNFNT